MDKQYLDNGNYTIAYYYDDFGNSIDKSKATKCMICEFDSNGKLIKEARLEKNNFKDDNDYGIKEYNNDAYPVYKK